MKESKIIKFREAEGEGKLIAEARELLGLNSESEAVRLLIKHGSIAIKDKYRLISECVTGMKPEQIANMLSSMKIRLIKEWKEQQSIKRDLTKL